MIDNTQTPTTLQQDLSEALAKDLEDLPATQACLDPEMDHHRRIMKYIAPKGTIPTETSKELVKLDHANTNTNRHVICIPKVNNKITKQYIFSIFCALKIGFVEKLTEVPIRNDPSHKRIFVKIKWNQSELSKYICKRFESGENVKVVYSDPWYWICVSNIRL
jgi:hypothetical protein